MKQKKEFKKRLIKKYGNTHYKKAQEILGNYSPKGSTGTTSYFYNNKTNKMTTEQKNQQKLIDTNLKAQKDAQQNDFKITARQKALSTAQFIRGANDTSDLILKDADKIYQWLIKPIK